MELTTLKTLRWIIPGAILWFAVLSVLSPDNISVAEAFAAETSLPSIVLGFLYYIFNPRFAMTGFSWVPLNDRISARLLQIVRANSDEDTRSQADAAGDRLNMMDVFYGIIDNDETLKVRKQYVYFDGLFVTTVLDLEVISVTAGTVHLAVYWFVGETAHGYWAATLLAVHVVSKLLLKPLAEDKHRKASDAQVAYIVDHKREDVVRRTQSALQGLRSTRGPSSV